MARQGWLVQSVHTGATEIRRPAPRLAWSPTHAARPCFAKLIGVSYASVNRWENEQARPNPPAWQRIRTMEAFLTHADTAESVPPRVVAPETVVPNLDFSADPNAVAAVIEAHRLTCGHLFNPAFAIETSRIDPLPHQRIAVYEHMLPQFPLRFSLADDAGAGKTS